MDDLDAMIRQLNLITLQQLMNDDGTRDEIVDQIRESKNQMLSVDTKKQDSKDVKKKMEEEKEAADPSQEPDMLKEKPFSTDINDKKSADDAG